MRMATQSDPKCASLRAHASLNPHPEQVSDALFQVHPFFDPRDLVQVKYEMLRRVRVTGQPVGSTAAAFGFSRVRLNQLRKRFEMEGLAGLLPQGKGPRRAHKLTEEVLTFIQERLKAEPEMRTADLPQCVAKQFGISVHLRSIERALVRRRKKGGASRPRRMRHRLQFGVWPSAAGNTKSYAAWPWRPGRTQMAMRWNWPISNAGVWRPGWRMCRPVRRLVLPRSGCRQPMSQARAAI
jgi:transposase